MSASAGPIAGNELFALFPSPLWTATLDAPSRDAAGAMVDGVTGDGALTRAGGDTPGAHRHSAVGLHRRPELAPLVALFVAEARDVLARLHVEHGPLEVVSCVAEAGTGVRPFDTIANAYLGGIYVARAPAGGCAIEFEDPRAQAHLLAPPRTTPAVPDAPRARIACDAGSLVLFPAFVRHRVLASDDGSCTTLALGLLFGRFADTVARPKWRGDAV